MLKNYRKFRYATVFGVIVLSLLAAYLILIPSVKMTRKAAVSFMLTFAVQYSRDLDRQSGFSAIPANKKYSVDSGYVLNRELLILRNDEFNVTVIVRLNSEGKPVNCIIYPATQKSSFCSSINSTLSAR